MSKKILNDFAELKSLEKELKKAEKYKYDITSSSKQNNFSNKLNNRSNQQSKNKSSNNADELDSKYDENGLAYDGSNATMADYFPNEENISFLDKLGVAKPSNKKKDNSTEETYLVGNVRNLHNTTSHSGQYQEVDLHIEALNPPKDLLKCNYLRFQLDIFEMTMRANIRHLGKKIVFIHGVGDGKLRSEIISLLDSNYWTCEYQDAPYKRFGVGGALMVTIH